MDVVSRNPRAMARQLLLSCAVGAAAGLAAWPARANLDGQWYLQTVGASHHFRETEAAGRTWNQRHGGLGIERREDLEGAASLRLSGGLLEDSRSFWGGYAGATYLKEWRDRGNWSAGIGMGGFLFYRSVSWRGDRQLVPGVLPTARFGLLDDRVGINLLYVPPVTWQGRAVPEVLYLQFVMKLR